MQKQAMALQQQGAAAANYSQQQMLRGGRGGGHMGGSPGSVGRGGVMTPTRGRGGRPALAGASGAQVIIKRSSCEVFYADFDGVLVKNLNLQILEEINLLHNLVPTNLLYLR